MTLKHNTFHIKMMCTYQLDVNISHFVTIANLPSCDEPANGGYHVA